MSRIARGVKLLVALTAVETTFAVITATAAVSTAVLALQPKKDPSYQQKNEL